MCVLGGGQSDSAPKPAPPAETLDQEAPDKKKPSNPAVFDEPKKDNPADALTIHKNKPTITGQTKKKMPTNTAALGSKKYQNDLNNTYGNNVFPNGLTIN
ncbi:hypothetical protein [Maritalea mediterranea]|uniref:Uncharacterized protein n=1 Tax=Maritalea mediterranea TaxID=2909667 RepID=A0ABS9ED31_9HYPH|nr:hypothetical protein [Maritalea mediterranea]MCF4099794.1 hypothetical protein [Maritalea mediterranea]